MLITRMIAAGGNEKVVARSVLRYAAVTFILDGTLSLICLLFYWLSFDFYALWFKQKYEIKLVYFLIKLRNYGSFRK